MNTTRKTNSRFLGIALAVAACLSLAFGASAQINVITVDCTPFVSPSPAASFGPDNTMGMSLQSVDQGADFNVTEVTPAAFRAMTAGQLAQFDLIALNNRPDRLDCDSGLGIGTTWHSVVGIVSGGRVMLNSHDAPRFKILAPTPGPPLFTGFEPFGTVPLVRQAALWAGGQPGTTGLLIFNDAARFLTVGGVGWSNPELNLPAAWGISDLDQDAGDFMAGGYTKILPKAPAAVYSNLTDARFAFNSIGSFSANIADTTFHSAIGTWNANIFTKVEEVQNAGVWDPGGFGVFGDAPAIGPDGTAITIIRGACPADGSPLLSGPDAMGCFDVTCAGPGNKVVLTMGFQPGSFAVPQCDVSMDLHLNSYWFGQADVNGNATFCGLPWYPRTQLWQAVDFDDCETTNVITTSP